MEKNILLQVIGLKTHFFSFARTRIVKAVDDVSFDVHAGDRLAVIGESGCGKSTVAASLLRVLPPSGETVSGKILFEGEDLLQKSNQEMNEIRGRKIAMILQDPMMSLDPVFTIGDQIGETLKRHTGLRGDSLIQRIKELLVAVNIQEPARRIKQWPHEMSGGMRQRIVGAIALSCEPKLLICDEATTNLDVTLQLQYLNLLKDLQKNTGVTLVFITHNLGIVAELCEDGDRHVCGQDRGARPGDGCFRFPRPPLYESPPGCGFWAAGYEETKTHSRRASQPGQPAAGMQL